MYLVCFLTLTPKCADFSAAFAAPSALALASAALARAAALALALALALAAAAVRAFAARALAVALALARAAASCRRIVAACSAADTEACADGVGFAAAAGLGFATTWKHKASRSVYSPGQNSITSFARRDDDRTPRVHCSSVQSMRTNSSVMAWILTGGLDPDGAAAAAGPDVSPVVTCPLASALGIGDGDGSTGELMDGDAVLGVDDARGSASTGGGEKLAAGVGVGAGVGAGDRRDTSVDWGCCAEVPTAIGTGVGTGVSSGAGASAKAGAGEGLPECPVASALGKPMLGTGATPATTAGNGLGCGVGTAVTDAGVGCGVGTGAGSTAFTGCP